MKDKKGFVMYRDMATDIEDLTTEQKGILFECIFKYQNDLNWKTEDKFVNFVMKQYIKIFERDRIKYDETCRKRKEAIKKRWAKKNNQLEVPTTNQIKLAESKGIDPKGKSKIQLGQEIEEEIKKGYYEEPKYNEVNVDTEGIISVNEVERMLNE